MKIKYRFSNCKNLVKQNKNLNFIIFMIFLLVASFLLSYSLVSSSQKKENEKLTALSAEVERLSEELAQKNAELAEVKKQLGK